MRSLRKNRLWKMFSNIYVLGIDDYTWINFQSLREITKYNNNNNKFDFSNLTVYK